MTDPVTVEVIANDPLFIPSKAHASDAGYDLRATTTFDIWEQDTQRVSAGIRLALPPECPYVLVLPRSGLAADHGITIVNSPGLIDQGYRGEIVVLLHKLRVTWGVERKHFKRGDKIAQLLFPVPVAFRLVDEFTDETDRGTNGFGSTDGKNNSPGVPGQDVTIQVPPILLAIREAAGWGM
jgi:dUTP pyrophosphatase